MNRWEVQFGQYVRPVIVIAPSAADAIIVAASELRRVAARFYSAPHAAPTISAEDMRIPWGIRWISSADVAMGEPPAVKEPTPWKCNICGVMHGPSTVDAHRHENDPRSTYYVAPHKDAP